MNTAYEAGKEYAERGWNEIILPRMERMLEMTEHVHEWRILLVTPNSATAQIRIRCRICNEPLLRQEAEARLNATERLSAETARDMPNCTNIGPIERERILLEYADILEGKDVS